MKKTALLIVVLVLMFTFSSIVQAQECTYEPLCLGESDSGYVDLSQSSASETIKAEHSGTGSGTKNGVFGRSYGNNGTKVGVRGIANGSGTNYGLYCQASGAVVNYGGYGKSGSGSYNYGFYGEVDSSPSGAYNFGMYGRSVSEDGGVNVGVYGSAADGSTNYGCYCSSSGTGFAGYFAGDVSTSGNYRFSSARTHYFHTSASLCVSAKDNPSTFEFARVLGGGITTSEASQSTDYEYLFCPVHIADGATLVEMNCYVDDSDPNGDLSVSLQTFLYPTGSSSPVNDWESTTYSGTPGTTTLTIDLEDYEVDNYSETYGIVFLFAPNTTLPNKLKAFNCRIEYTVEQLNL